MTNRRLVALMLQHLHFGEAIGMLVVSWFQGQLYG